MTFPKNSLCLRASKILLELKGNSEFSVFHNIVLNLRRATTCKCDKSTLQSLVINMIKYVILLYSQLKCYIYYY